MNAPDSALKDRVVRAIAQRPSPTRSQWLRRTSALLVLAGLGVLATFEVFGGASPGMRPPLLVLGTAIGSFALAAVASWSAFGRGSSTLGRPRGWQIATSIATPVLLFVWLLIWASYYPEAAAPVAGRVGYRCMGLTLVLGAWPLSAFVLSRRRTDPRHPRVTGAALGVAAGACAAVLVDLWCPIMEPSHLVIGHALPLVIMAVIGALVAAPVLAIRTRK